MSLPIILQQKIDNLREINLQQKRIIDDLVDTLKAYAGVAPKNIFAGEDDEHPITDPVSDPTLALKKLREYNLI